MYKLHFKMTKSGLGEQKYLDARIMERASVIVFFQSIINKILIIFSLKKKKKGRRRGPRYLKKRKFDIFHCLKDRDIRNKDNFLESALRDVFNILLFNCLYFSKIKTQG